ncbi:MAG: hemerythrin domain-containing protein [Spirochaetia bacterium]|nr:hemerythrin domain-containing protein [Spirochaetia bacterium]
MNNINDIKEKPKQEIVQHIISEIRPALKERFEQLIFLSDKVENVHSSHDECPKGLTASLKNLSELFINHIKKEDEILLKLTTSKEQNNVESEIKKASKEHDEIIKLLDSISNITNKYQLPERACNTWTLLYQQLGILEKDLKFLLDLEESALFKNNS